MATLLLTPGLTYRELSIVASLHRHHTPKPAYRERELLEGITGIGDVA
jgi:hypothetical protein